MRLTTLVRSAGAVRNSLQTEALQASDLLRCYEQDVAGGVLKAVNSQKSCIQALSDLLDLLPSYTAAVGSYNVAAREYREKREALHQLLKKQEAAKEQDIKSNGGSFWKQWRNQPSPADAQADALKAAMAWEQKLDELLGPEPTAPRAPTGLYLYGSVGSGKTMLMDRFYEAVRSSKAVLYSRRVHFNTALLEVHHLMHEHDRMAKSLPAANSSKQNSQDPEIEKQKQARLARIAVRRYMRQRLKQSDAEIADSIARSNAVVFSRVAARLIQGSDGILDSNASPSNEETTSEELSPGVLCFDEVNVNDPFTALALKGIFEALLDTGTVMVATSNRPPWDLNHFGVHEAIFEHFKRRLQSACAALQVSCPDFRRNADGTGLGGNYLFPLEAASATRMEQLWLQAIEAEGRAPCQQVVPVMFGRHLTVNAATGRVARFSFRELCDAPKGASDYYAIAQRFHTVFVTGIPAMSLQKRNLARRFILLVDELYNARVNLICTAEAPPDELFAGTADDQPVFDPDELEQTQFESAAEGSRLRRNVLAEGGVAPLFSAGSSSVTSSHLGGLEERFAFARAISRLYEMSRMGDTVP